MRRWIKTTTTPKATTVVNSPKSPKVEKVFKPETLNEYILLGGDPGPLMAKLAAFAAIIRAARKPRPKIDWAQEGF